MKKTKEEISKYQEKWHKEHYETITVHVPKGMKSRYKETAKKAGISLNRLVEGLLFEFETQMEVGNGTD